MTLTIVPNCLIVDVSHWQEPTALDWKAAHDNGNVHGVIVKFMQDGEPDTAGMQHLMNAYAAGVELLGMYDFGTVSDDHRAFINAALGDFQQSLTTRLIALDAERYPTSQMNVADAEVWSEAIFAVERRHPTLYMGKDGPDGTGADLPSALLSKCDLWLPKYGSEPTVESLPPGFHLPTGDLDRGGALRLWQFTGDGIDKPAEWPVGIPDGCDLSYAIFTSLAALTTWWGS